MLQVLKLGLGGPREFLGAAPQPPPTRAVDAALDDLLAIGCVARVGGEEVADDDDESSSDDDENPHGDDGELFSFSSAMLAESSHDEEDDEEDAPIEDDRWLLTPLGEHVASLPVDCRVGKLLTSRNIRDRLAKELEVNVALRVEPAGGDVFEVRIRGNQSTSAEVVDHGDGTYSFSYMLTRAGKYVVCILHSLHAGGRKPLQGWLREEAAAEGNPAL